MIHPTALIGEPPETREVLRGEQARESCANEHRPVIADTAHVGPFVTVDSGTVRSTIVGEGALLLAHSHVGHDAQVRDRAEVCTGAVIGGHAEIGEDAKIGLNATVLPFRNVGRGAVIGAGAVVDKDVPAGETWVGVPASRLEPGRRDPRPHTERTPEDSASFDDGREEWERMFKAQYTR